VLACGSRRPQRAGDATATIPQCRRRSVGLFHDLRLRCPARHESMTHVWNERYWALSAHTYRVLYDAGINEKLADELATHRTLAVALKPRGRPFPDFAAAASDYFDPARFTDRTRKLFVPRVRRHPPPVIGRSGQTRRFLHLRFFPPDFPPNSSLQGGKRCHRTVSR